MANKTCVECILEERAVEESKGIIRQFLHFMPINVLKMFNMFKFLLAMDGPCGGKH